MSSLRSLGSFLSALLIVPVTGAQEVRFEHLFTVPAAEAELAFDRRPTPVIAVRDVNAIAVPTRQHEIGIFDSHGRKRATLHFPGDYPTRLAFTPDGDLLALYGRRLHRWSFAANRVVPEGATAWWSLRFPDLEHLVRGVPADDEVLPTGAGDGVWIQSRNSVRRPGKRAGSHEIPLRLKAELRPGCFLAGGDGWEYPSVVQLLPSGETASTALERMPLVRVSAVPLCTGSPRGETTKESNQLYGSYWLEGALYRVVHLPCGLAVTRYTVTAAACEN